MQERPAKSGTRVPKGASTPTRTVRTAKPTVDKFPKHPAEWRAFADLPADERSAIYLRSIRAMMLFFTVLTVIGIISTIVLLLIGINAANDTTTVNTNPFG
jgi:hypothetical protein